MNQDKTNEENKFALSKNNIQYRKAYTRSARKTKIIGAELHLTLLTTQLKAQLNLREEKSKINNIPCNNKIKRRNHEQKHGETNINKEHPM